MQKQLSWLLSLAGILQTGYSQQSQVLNTSKIAVFQNNIVYGRKEGTVKFEGQKATLIGIPESLFDQYWVTAKESNITKAVFSSNDTIMVQTDAKDFYELLRANIGSQAEVTYQIGNEVESVTGEILPFNSAGEIIAVRKANGSTVFIQKSQMKQVAIQGDVKTKFLETKTGRATKLTIEKNLPSAQVHVQYFQKGISWTPSYSLKLINDQEAHFTMKCLIDNSVDNFEDINLELVVGEPNLKGGSQLGPLAASLAAVAELNRVTAKPKDKPAIKDSVKTGKDSVAVAVNKPKEEELFVYPVGKTSLTKGSQTFVTVFSSNISCQDIAEVSIPNYFEGINVRNTFTQFAEVNAYRSLYLTPNQKNPLLKGSVFILDESGTPITQDTLPMIRPGAKHSIRISQLPITGKVDEIEVNREVRAKKIDKNSYDKVRIKGTVNLKNLDSKKQTLTIRKTLSGLLLKTGGAVVETSELKTGVNNVHDLFWKVDLTAGGSQLITYEYEAWILNN